MPCRPSASMRVAGAFAYPGVSLSPILRSEGASEQTFTLPIFYPEPDGESLYQSRTIIGGRGYSGQLSKGSRTSGVIFAKRLKNEQIRGF